MKSKNKVNRRDFIVNGLKSVVMGAIVFISGIFRWNDANSECAKTPTNNDLENIKKNSTDLLNYSEVMQIPLKFKEARGVAVGSNGDIYAAADKSVQIFSSGGTLKSAISTGSDVYNVTLDKNDDIYLGMSTHVEVFDKFGKQKALWKSSGKNAIITSIAVSDEFVFVADAGNHIVWKYSKSGEMLLRIGDRNDKKDIPGFIVPSPFFDVSIDPDGFLWVANPGRHSLENYTFDGDLRTSWGKRSIGMEGFCGCCNPSNLQILSNGKFLTAEKGIPRVKIYNRIGMLESVVAGPSKFMENTQGLSLAEDSNGKIYVLDPKKKQIRIFDKNS